MNLNTIAQQIVRCPVGCAFLYAAERDGISPSELVTPRESLIRLASARVLITPWDAEFSKIVHSLVAHGPMFLDLALRILKHPGNWWAEPIDRNHQMMLLDPLRNNPSKPDPWWEAYAERPVAWQFTSTEYAGLSSVDAAVGLGVGEWPMHETFNRIKAEIATDARVFEIAGPQDWHRLCVSYPSHAYSATYPTETGVVTPDWKLVRREWDGIHMTFLSQLTTPFVRHASREGITMMWSWDCEGALWLNRETVQAGEAMREAEGIHDAGRITTDELHRAVRESGDHKAIVDVSVAIGQNGIDHSPELLNASCGAECVSDAGR